MLKLMTHDAVILFHAAGGLDSLEHLEPCPPPRKDKMSLSRDSGLTMSDSQLFTPDEEESGSTSSSGSGRAAGRFKVRLVVSLQLAPLRNNFLNTCFVRFSRKFIQTSSVRVATGQGSQQKLSPVANFLKYFF